MPAKSKAQQRLMAMALHNPDKIQKKNREVLKMGKKSLEDFASTKTGKLPDKVAKSDEEDNNYLVKYDLRVPEDLAPKKKKKSDEDYDITVKGLKVKK